MRIGAPRPVAKVGAILGEGPVWFGGALWFVDIKAPAIFRFDPATDALDRWSAPAQVGWVLPAADGTIVAGLQTGLHRFDPATGGFALLTMVEPERPGNRLNDACVDPAGRLWFGSMDDAESAPSGAIYRAAADGLVRVIDGIVITNGPAVSPDGATLYHHDTLGGLVFASDLAANGSIANTRIFASIDPADGYPDGPTVDAEGCVWIGLYAGWGVRRYAPDGRLLGSVPFPVANITKIAFGGPGLATAYATTARKGLTPAMLAQQPHAGDLFAFDPGVPGLPCPPIDALFLQHVVQR
jgi:sugar lactone lactonase YvrE